MRKLRKSDAFTQLTFQLLDFCLMGTAKKMDNQINYFLVTSNAYLTRMMHHGEFNYANFSRNSCVIIFHFFPGDMISNLSSYFSIVWRIFILQHFDIAYIVCGTEFDIIHHMITVYFARTRNNTRYCIKQNNREKLYQVTQKGTWYQMRYYAAYDYYLFCKNAKFIPFNALKHKRKNERKVQKFLGHFNTKVVLNFCRK